MSMDESSHAPSNQPSLKPSNGHLPAGLAATQNERMDIELPVAWLGGLSPQAFMRHHWQKKPLLIRQALPGDASVLSRSELFTLAASEAVESRLVVRNERGWALRHGPFRRSSLPPLRQPNWTLLVQGLDLHLAAARLLLDRFRFVPDARLDDVMVSYATDGGGVGPHVDSYDVFLLQTHGRRRWRVGKVGDAALVPDVPLKLLSSFAPQFEWLLEPGDMLYLPPGWGHDGVAEGDCMTCSIGFRAPRRSEIATGVLQRVLDAAEPPDADPLYRDAKQLATGSPGRIPTALRDFAAQAVARLLADQGTMACSLGELLSEPKSRVSFQPTDEAAPVSRGVGLDRRTRMLYDDAFVFINGESYRASGRDARLMRCLADRRALTWREMGMLGGPARDLLDEWLRAGWLHPRRNDDVGGRP